MKVAREGPCQLGEVPEHVGCIGACKGGMGAELVGEVEEKLYVSAGCVSGGVDGDA